MGCFSTVPRESDSRTSKHCFLSHHLQVWTCIHSFQCALSPVTRSAHNLSTPQSMRSLAASFFGCSVSSQEKPIIPTRFVAQGKSVMKVGASTRRAPKISNFCQSSSVSSAYSGNDPHSRRCSQLSESQELCTQKLLLLLVLFMQQRETSSFFIFFLSFLVTLCPVLTKKIAVN